MKKALNVLLILAVVGTFGLVAAAEETARGFGFGGPTAVAFFPDLSEVNAFLSASGLDPFSDFLLGGGGSGRGGVIGGPVAGGIGWGVVAESKKGDRYAELVFGGGGADFGTAIGGDDSSVLTVGTILGGGAMVLDSYLGEAEPSSLTPEGLVIEPVERTVGLAVGFIQPYVSMEAQLLQWLGIELRIGYVLPVFGIPFGSDVGISPSSLRLSGPMVSLGLVFGGIGFPETPEEEEPSGTVEVTEISAGTFFVRAGEIIAIENGLGDVTISTYPIDAIQTAPNLVVEWQATRTCSEKRIDELQAVTEATDAGTRLSTVGRGRVDYVVRIPSGIDLTVRNGTGNVTIDGHEAQTIIVENGVGNVELRGVRSAALIVAAGAGKIDLPDVDAETLIAELGIGGISLGLPEDASVGLIARARIGDVSIDRFPGMIGGVRGLIGKSGDVRLGDGTRTAKLTVGIGEIQIEARDP